MLPWDLALYRIRKGRVYARFRDLSGQHWDAAQNVIDAFLSYVGRTKWELEKKLEELTITPEYKFIKGLIKLMERRCIYEDGSEAIDFRRKVFKRFPEDPEVRAKELNMNKEDMLRRMFADINPRLVKVMKLSAVELLKQYNLSLAQTLLFKATSIDVHFSNPAVYRAIKYFGLIYRMSSENRIIVDGPASLFSSTTRYGTRFARLLPYIISQPPWSLRAYLKIKGEETLFEINHIRHGYYFPVQRELDFEEEQSPFRFKICRAERFGKPVKIGSTYAIPDYRIVCENREAYAEIFRFWTRKYIEERAKEALEKNVPFLFLLKYDGNVSNHDAPELANVIIFRSRVKEDSILKFLRSISVCSLEVMDEKSEYVAQSKGILEDVAKQLESVGRYEEAEKIIKSAGLPVMETLHALGYRVVWRGLIPHKIRKVK